MREAEKLCDRVAIIHRGQILADGTLEELRDLHQQRDLEELFFQLISRHDEAHPPPAAAPQPGRLP
jgi:sodium transport system ATP-binding protein